MVISWLQCVKEFGFYGRPTLEIRNIVFGYVQALNDTENISDDLFGEVLKCIGICQTEEEWKVG